MAKSRKMDEFWAGEVTENLENLDSSIRRIDKQLSNHLSHHQDLEKRATDKYFKIIITVVMVTILIIDIITNIKGL